MRTSSYFFTVQFCTYYKIFDFMFCLNLHLSGFLTSVNPNMQTELATYGRCTLKHMFMTVCQINLSQIPVNCQLVYLFMSQNCWEGVFGKQIHKC